MSNKDHIEVLGKTIVEAKRIDDTSAVIKLDDGTVITFGANGHYDQMIGHWSTLKVDVI